MKVIKTLVCICIIIAFGIIIYFTGINGKENKKDFVLNQEVLPVMENQFTQKDLDAALLDALQEPSRWEDDMPHEPDWNKVKQLVKQGADVKQVDIYGDTVLMYVCRYNGDDELVKEIIKAGADVNALNNRKLTALMFAPSASAAEILIKAGASPNVKDYDGITPLHKAARSGNIKLLKVLLNAKADINAADNQGKTPLMYAAVFNNYMIVEGFPPKHIASNERHLAALQILIAAGADVNAADKQGNTALIWAARLGKAGEFNDIDIVKSDDGGGQTGIIRELLKAGADINAKDKQGFTALKHAQLNTAQIPVYQVFGGLVKIPKGEENKQYESPLNKLRLEIVDILKQAGAQE